MVFKRGVRWCRGAWELCWRLRPSKTVHGNCASLCLCVTGTSLFPGIKVIGGIKELTGEEYGVYVKRILPGGVAYADGELNMVQSATKSETSQKTLYLFYMLPYQTFQVLPPIFSSSGGIFLLWQSL